MVFGLGLASARKAAKIREARHLQAVHRHSHAKGVKNRENESESLLDMASHGRQNFGSYGAASKPSGSNG